MRNGALTVMALPGKCPPSTQVGCGWFYISNIGRSHTLHPLLRCPRHRRWCGELESVAWSPTGRFLAFTVTSIALSNPSDGLHIYDTRTRRDRHLAHAAGVVFGWSPDGRQLAVPGDGAITLLDVDGAGVSQVPTRKFGRLGAASWSPDGNWLAFAARRPPDKWSSVYVVRVDGTDGRRVVRHGAAPAWSPDGTRIAFASGRGIAFVTPNGRLLSPRPPFVGGVPVGFNAAPVWSPDGKKIALVRRRSYPGTWVMNADGSGLHRVSRSVSGFFGTVGTAAWRPR